MWTELIDRLYDGAEFAEPAPAGEIDEITRRLGQDVPAELRALLAETNGATARTEDSLVWPAQEIVRQNVLFRSDPDFPEIYMSFDQLMFIAGNGGGDQFAFRCVPNGLDDVFVWEHELDQRFWVARSLQDYLERRATGGGGDGWYQ